MPTPDKCAFALNQRVYFVLDSEARGIVTGIIFRAHGGVLYEVTWEDKADRAHTEQELSAEPVYDTAAKPDATKH